MHGKVTKNSTGFHCYSTNGMFAGRRVIPARLEVTTSWPQPNAFSILHQIKLYEIARISAFGHDN
jgi:hypothetical protein